MTAAPQIILDGLVFPEVPRWHDGELYFSDMLAQEVMAITPNGARRTVYVNDGPVSGLGWLPDGRMLIVSVVDRRLIRLEADGRAVTHADLSSVATHFANDMVVDASGRAYVGNVGYDMPNGEQAKPARLARADPDGSVHEAADDLHFPNGTVITADGRTLIIAETMAGRLTAFDVAEDGGLSGRRIWAQLAAGTVPDGICLDAEGAIWVASPYTNEALRVREGGEVTDRVAAGRGVYACMLGADDRRTLFLMTASDNDPEKCLARRSGRIEAVAVEVPGVGLP